MDILIIGFSNLFRTRILPLIDELKFLNSLSVAKYCDQTWGEVSIDIRKPLIKYDDYETALNEFKGEIVYI